MGGCHQQSDDREPSVLKGHTGRKEGAVVQWAGRTWWLETPMDTPKAWMGHCLRSLYSSFMRGDKLGKFRSNQPCIWVPDEPLEKWWICLPAELNRNLIKSFRTVKKRDTTGRPRGQAAQFCFVVTHLTSAGPREPSELLPKWSLNAFKEF